MCKVVRLVREESTALGFPSPQRSVAEWRGGVRGGGLHRVRNGPPPTPDPSPPLERRQVYAVCASLTAAARRGRGAERPCTPHTINNRRWSAMLAPMRFRGDEEPQLRLRSTRVQPCSRLLLARADTLAQLEEALPRVARQEAQPLAQIVDPEMIGTHAFRQLLPGERCRHRRVLARACRIGRDRGRAATVAEIVDEDTSVP